MHPLYLRHCLLVMALMSTEVFATSTAVGISRQQYGESIAYDMNATGQIAAVIKEKNGTPHAVFYDKGQLVKLELPGETESEAKHINDRGEVIGYSKIGSVATAFIRDRFRHQQELGTLGGPNSYGIAINNEGAATGFADTADGDWHAFLYKPGATLKDLGTLGGKISYASGINSLGQVAGTATTEDGSRHAFIYDGSKGMTDLGTLGGRYSSATAVNDKGVVVGTSETSDHRWHAFIYDGKNMLDLGKKIGVGNSFATGINNDGQVAGIVDVEDMRYTFVWRNNKITMHPSGKSLYLTNAINEAGQVIGASYDHGLNAATMPSNAIPFVDLGGNKILGFNIFVIAMALLAAVYRKRLKGLFFQERLFF
ncbi:HAF repeat-containing protein [Undibacterium sp. RuRC25W]|uniref:HAF repeat-containing protein n=1 Tax=Undibacterium sp. RuRC25W TaxID=3413047 RepID=UPI003BF2BDFD